MSSCHGAETLIGPDGDDSTLTGFPMTRLIAVGRKGSCVKS